MAANKLALNAYDPTNTNPSFRAFGSAISGQFSTFGWVQTADTGQINWSTVVKADPAGYEIWRLADTLQATSPFFIKLEYGIGSGFANDLPEFFITIGTSSDGAGNLTGQVSQRFGIRATSHNASPQNCYFSGDTSRFQMCLWDGPLLNEAVVLSIERSKDASGADNADGLIVLGGSNAGIFQQFCPYLVGTGLYGNALANWVAAVNQAQPTMAYGAQIGIAPAIPFYARPWNYGMGVIVYQGTDYAYASTPSIPVYGSNHTYLVLNQSAWNPTSPAVGSHVLLRYE